MLTAREYAGDDDDDDDDNYFIRTFSSACLFLCSLPFYLFNEEALLVRASAVIKSIEY
jgi:hypothetical protein